MSEMIFALDDNQQYCHVHIVHTDRGTSGLQQSQLLHFYEVTIEVSSAILKLKF